MPASLAAASRGMPSSALASASRRALTRPAGEAAQLGQVVVGADRQGCGHGGVSEDNAAGTPQAPDRSVTSSSGRYHELTCEPPDKIRRLLSGHTAGENLSTEIRSLVAPRLGAGFCPPR